MASLRQATSCCGAQPPGLRSAILAGYERGWRVPRSCKLCRPQCGLPAAVAAARVRLRLGLEANGTGGQPPGSGSRACRSTRMAGGTILSRRLDSRADQLAAGLAIRVAAYSGSHFSDSHALAQRASGGTRGCFTRGSGLDGRVASSAPLHSRAANASAGQQACCAPTGSCGDTWRAGFPPAADHRLQSSNGNTPAPDIDRTCGCAGAAEDSSSFAEHC